MHFAYNKNRNLVLIINRFAASRSLEPPSYLEHKIPPFFFKYKLGTDKEDGSKDASLKHPGSPISEQGKQFEKGKRGYH
jgi:hypothetical protein